MRNYLLGFICLSTFLLSCKEKRGVETNKNESKKTLGKLNTDSIAPPVVIPYTQTPVKLSPVITSKPTSLHENLGKEVITSISSESGLPLGRYRQVLQDDRGNLWMNNGTELVKYDGITFHSYKPPVKHLFILNILIDKQKNIWVAVLDEKRTFTNSRQIICFYFDGFSFHKVPGGLVESVSNPLYDFYFSQGPDKSIWIADNNRKKIMVYDGPQLMRTIDLKENVFKTIVDLSFVNNDIWITDMADTSLTRYDGSQFKKYTTKEGLPAARFWNSIPLSQDSIYLNTDLGLYLYQKGRSVKIIDSTAGSSLFGSSFLADSSTGVWVRLRNDKVLKHSSYGNVFFGKDDGLDDLVTFNSASQDNSWAGTINKLIRFYRPIVNFRNIFPNSKGERIYPYLQDSRGNYWFGSFGSGIYRYDDKEITQYFFPNKGVKTIIPSNNSIDAIKEDKKGNIWFSTFDETLLKFDGQNFTEFSNLGSPVFPVHPYKVFIDSKENLWFIFSDGNSSIGAGYFNGRETVCFGTAQGLANTIVRCIYEDSKGMMWFGTLNGLSRFDGKSFTNFNINDGLPDNHVECLMEDAYGRLLIGTSNGLSLFDGEKFLSYTKEDGLSSVIISSIQKTPDNKQFWLGTRAGMTNMRFRSADSISFVNLDELNGFSVRRFDFLADKDGVLWGNDEKNNLKRIDYNNIKVQAKPFSIHLSNILINNTSLCWSNLMPGDKSDSLAMGTEMEHRFGKALKADELDKMGKLFKGIKFDSLLPFDFIPVNLVLPYASNAVSFEFAAIDPQFSKYTRYQYMLEGFDKNWSPLSRNTSANFGKLSEGRYTFKVKALNMYGLWSEMSYSFKVLPPWYRTWWAYTLYALMFVAGIFLFIAWRTRALQKEKIVLEERVTTRTAELKESLENLKATQTQLVQSEKMASLGELTAGIAHEIQNPLNFVNNFSEVNTELIDELSDEASKGNLEEVKAIAKDIKENEQKINHHGKRADAIVKGMLQHSRSSSGVKEPTDINALADEYLRLAYHGLRAKDKSFNATMKTDFDESIGNINIIPQDIGRVVLNLINNAFYVVDEKEKAGITNYEPTVSVSTKKSNDKVEIRVADNGNGIPQKVIDKIFQPFFTTKPTGSGTGLGLSLSYDIVKAHGGEITVNTKEGEGTAFIIQLPVS